jgi:hypothetical protein
VSKEISNIDQLQIYKNTYNISLNIFYNAKLGCTIIIYSEKQLEIVNTLRKNMTTKFMSTCIFIEAEEI